MSSIASVQNITSHVSTSGLSTFSSRVREMSLRFHRKEGQYLCPSVQHICEDGVHFYGIHRNDQMAKNSNGSDDVKNTVKKYEKIKSHLLSQMKLQPNTVIYQIVGDSAPYSLEGTQRGIHFMKSYAGSAVWVYGYTGHAKENGTKCVNGIVSSIDQPLKVGNLVGFHTPEALDKWGCSGPLLQHYFLVYGDDDTKRETGTVFGDDVTTSDFITDELLLLEGGIQSFRQACNVLMLDRRVTAIDDLRGDNTRYAVLPDGSKKSYFSAPEFLKFMKEKVSSSSQITDEVLDGWYNEYLEPRLLSDPKRQDHDTKRKLLDDAWKLFKSEKLHLKLHLFTLTNNFTFAKM